MAACPFDGNSDMYGLGIRLGFYLQWNGGNLASWLAPSEVPSIRFGNNIFVAATFLALIILTARDADSLQVVETYIILLLTFGSYLSLVPLFAWRLLTACNPYWDPSRWPIVRPSRVESTLSILLLLGVSAFQLWFWFARVPDLDGQSCREYGFFFGRVRLNANWFQILNIILYFFLLLICIVLLCITVALKYELVENQKRPKISKLRKRNLRNLHSIFNLIVANTTIAATELTIHWNKIRGVHTISSAGQTIPFVIGIGIIVRILYVKFYRRPRESRPHHGPRPSPSRDPDDPGNLPPRFGAPPRQGSHSSSSRDPDDAGNLPPRFRGPPRQGPYSSSSRDPEDTGHLPERFREMARQGSHSSSSSEPEDVGRLPPRRAHRPRRSRGPVDAGRLPPRIFSHPQ